MWTAERWEARRDDGIWLWEDRSGEVEVRFAGKGSEDCGVAEVLGALVPAGFDVARLEQMHSATVVEAKPGMSGRGDALIAKQKELALCIVTADCVPVLLASGQRIAAVHAGWRGLAARILPAALCRLESTSSAIAWIGPVIGPCCYEVGEDVARRVDSACADRVVRPGSGERPHLDLAAAARSQLQELGVSRIRAVDACTRCQPDRLWSYRRDGDRCGRNVALVWRVAKG